MIAFFAGQKQESNYRILFKDILSNGVLQLIKLSEGSYTVSFESLFSGCSWTTGIMDYETARSTYADVIYGEFI
ncbi:hypothetical protein MSHOH_2139 [Methanosarcina horonobensis HB-1 = JCM 15518]|uniref:Uncharacterized protein n=1 Tax=Methanosarcina horonobensis HB-1 = JCM 15518 TaxID=1434110 RepID=A0A0E3SEK9_9EURY|nr:hypothetical protein [Methanosarcina horonobensis]AKB78622.1 hypothetical protein MSHOH_2139 [Methanosarcina horonobensis HB-1 = JCM 15518]